MVIRVTRRVDVLLELVEPRPVGPVIVRGALFVLDDAALIVQVLLVERAQQRRHPIGLEPERQFELVARDGLEVVGAIQEGGPIHRAAGPLDKRHVLGLGHVARTLEHDVLEEVREAGLAGDLVLGADVVPDVDRGDGRQVILRDDQAEAVGQALIGELDARGGHYGLLLRVSARLRPHSWRCSHCRGRARRKARRRTTVVEGCDRGTRFRLTFVSTMLAFHLTRVIGTHSGGYHPEPRQTDQQTRRTRPPGAYVCPAAAGGDRSSDRVRLPHERLQRLRRDRGPAPRRPPLA